jgi:tRNA dimethylallyltransferase
MGPTASGKTAVAIEVAKALGTEIISADARQFYAEIPIGTAQPSTAELQMAPHHLIGHLSVSQTYTAGDFERDVLKLLEQLFKQHQVVVLVGGSGLYVKAVYEGLHALPLGDENLRTELHALFAQKGIEALQQELLKVDPSRLEKIDAQNPQRLMRAIEIAKANQGSFEGLITTPKAERPFRILKVALNPKRELLYNRINNRVLDMVANGLEQEAAAMVPFKENYALKTVGYKEWFEYFEGAFNRIQTIERIQQHTRNYAKKQVTWLRREKDLIWIENENPAEQIMQLVAQQLTSPNPDLGK